MSGIEVAGLVLGAFPVAIDLLKKYQEVARRMGFWYKIQLEYKKCSDSVRFYRLAYSRHLRQLLLPLVADDEKIKELMSDPGGQGWKESAMADLLESRLGRETYELYLDLTQNIQQSMGKLNHELAFDSKEIQENLKSQKDGRLDARLRQSLTREGMMYQLYKFKFSNGESTRTELFGEIKTYIDNLEKLLDSSDKDTQLVRDRAAASKASALDSSLITFWRRAAKLFQALASSWNSCHEHQHWARLLLQHRTTQQKKHEFSMLFAKAIESNWEIRQTQIVEEHETSPTVGFGEAQKVESSAQKLPSHRGDKPLKSALKAPSITITPTVPIQIQAQEKAVSNLCIALNEGADSCCGFLAEEDCRYYVHRVSRSILPNESFPMITLTQIIQGDVQPAPGRRQRYALALIISSSFLQLLDTPWLPLSWSKLDIAFLPVEGHSGGSGQSFALDQPQLRSDLHLQEHTSKAPTPANFRRSLDLLGIILLELCFGKLLETHPCRKSWPAGNNETERVAFDTMAAREWQLEVNDEAGPDYAEAVSWCLGGNRSTPAELWRQEMLVKVVQPLERCREYMSS